MFWRKVILFGVAIVATLCLSGCGGSSSPTSIAVTASVTTVDGTDTVALTATVANDSGTDGVTWSVTGGGALSKETTSSATYTAPAATNAAQTVTITATSVADTSLNGTLKLTVPAKLTISTTTTQLVGVVGSTYSVQLTTSTGTPPYTWSLAAGSALPSCLSMSKSGLITSNGPLTAACVVDPNVTFDVTDSGTPNPMTASETLSIVIAYPPVVFTTATTLPVGYVGSSYSKQLAASGGSGSGYTYALASGSSLPAGLTLSGAGLIKGSPTAAGGPTSVKITVTDSAKNTATVTFSITINAAVSFTTATTLPTGYVGASYSQQLAATGGSGSGYTYAVASGSTLPAGLSLTTGLISGKPTTAGGPTNVSITATDGVGNTVTTVFSITINPAVSFTTATTLPTGFVGTNYSQQLAATGGSGSGYKYALASGSSLPAGLTLTAAGLISGQPTTAGGPTSVSITATDGVGNSVTTAFSITINAGLGITNSTTLNTGYVGSNYSEQLTAGGGSGTGYSFTAQNLPTGLSINSTGLISGSPTTAGGPTSVTITVTDSLSHSANVTFSITINAAVSFTTPATLPTGYVGSNYSQQLAATGGSGSGYTYAVASGSTLPAGLSLTTGLISGKPTTAGGPTNVSITATDGVGNTVTTVFSITINAAVSFTTPVALPTGFVGTNYSQQLAATGGSGSGYTFALASGSNLPAGLSLTSGLISGKPTTAGGPTNVSITATDGVGNSVTTVFSITINAGLGITNSTTLNPGIIGGNYSEQLTAGGGSGTGYSFAAQNLPAGLTISSTGLITGSPTATGTTSNVLITVTDSLGHTAKVTCSITINAQMVLGGPNPLPTGNVGASYSAQLTVTGGSGSVTIALASGYSLPGGLGISATGLISGIPTAVSGPTSVKFTATDSWSDTTSTTFTITINPALGISNSTLNTAYAGSNYSDQLTATGGSGSGYTYSATGLPSGMSISAAGLISGKPTTTTGSPFTVVVTLTDSVASSQKFSLTLTVNPGVSFTTATTLPLGYVGTSYSQQLAATGGSGAGYTYAVANGSNLPAGLTLAAGLISGKPTTAGGPTSVSLTATDGVGNSVTTVFSITIDSGVSFTTPTTLPTGYVGLSYSKQLAAAGGSGSGYSYALANGSNLPAGLGINSSGLISGQPTTAGGPVSVSITATDGVGNSVTTAFSITISAGISFTTASPLPTGYPGTSYSQQIVVSGGNGTYSTWSWVATNGTPLPSGLGISATGLINGTPANTTTSSVVSNVAITVTDSVGNTATGNFTLTIEAAIAVSTASPLPTGVKATPYSVQLHATGGTGGTVATGGTGITSPYTWSVSTSDANNLFAALNLNLNSSGLLSGTTPIAGGPVVFTANVSDGSHTAQASLSVTINASLTIQTTTLSPNYVYAGTNGYSQTLTVVGGISPYTWSLTSGTLPTWMSLGTSTTATDTLSGNVPMNPTPGLYTFTVQVKDSTGASTSQQYNLNVYGTLSLQPAGALHAAITGANYGANNVGINATGGSGTYSFSVNGTAIPATDVPTTIASADSLTGTFNSGGNTLWLGGTPPNSETVTLNVTVTDIGVTPNVSDGPVQYTIVVGPQQPLALPNPTNALPNGTMNQGYNAGLNASGGANGVNYSFSVKIGTATTVIPTNNQSVTLTNGDGLTAWNSGGNTLFFGGTPTAAASLTLIITVSDSANDTPATQSYPVAIINPNALYTVSGTITYAGTQKGWVFVRLINNSNNCGNCGSYLGTAINATTAGSLATGKSFTIKGVSPGTYSVQAYMDFIGNGAENASDPAGTSGTTTTVSTGNATGANDTLIDPSAVTVTQAPSISVAGTFATGAFVQLGNYQTNNNGVEMAASYTVRWSNNSGFGSGTVLGSQSFAATGGSNAPWIVSGITNCTPSCYFEVQGVAGSSTSPWSTATTAVTIAAPYSGNAVSGKVTFTAPTGGIKGPLYVGFYDMTTGNVYATVVGSKAAPPTSPASYSLYVPTGTNYFFFGMVDQNNTGLLNVPGSISNTNNQSNATTTIDPSQPSTLTQNLTLATNVAGTGPQNAYAVVRTSHNQNNYANDNYQIDLRVNGAYKLPVSVELTSGANVLVPVDIATGAFNGNNDEFDFWPNLNGATPNVGDAYSFLVTYSDGTQETLNITISAVLNAFATLNSPAANVTGVSLTPNFSWTDPANASNYYYQFQLQDSNNNTIWKIPGNHSNSNGFSSSTTSLTWGNDPTGNNATPTVTSLSSLSTYQWSIQVSDANGDEATEQVTFETMESTLSLPSNSIPGSALVNNAYSQSLNASGGSGVDTFTVNGSTGTTNNNVTTWTLTDGLIASTTVGSNQLTVSGTPTTAPATVTLDVAVADNQGHSVSAVQYTIDVVNGPNGANNKYLSGTYVCKFDGFNDSDGSRWTSLSNVKANGAAGTMTSGIWDMNGRDFSSEMSGTATGTYSIGPDNNGLLTMNSTVTSGGSGTHTGQYAIALNNTGSSITATEFRMVEIDDVGSSPSGMTGTGHCYQANTSVFATDPYKGNSFVFMMNGENGSGTPQATLGRFVAGSTTGSITGGIVDQAKVSDSSVTTITFTGGSYTTPDSTNGRSTLTFNTSGGAVSFQVYDIDANRMFMIQTTDAKAQSADVRKQQQATYSGTNLNGPFVLYTQTYEYSNGSISGYASEVMQGTGNGASGLTLNQNYTDEDGTYKVGNDTGSGTLTFDSSNPGRASLSTSYLYFFDNNTAFFLSGGASGGNGSGTILETGWTEPQTGSFTNAAIAGDYLLGQLPLMEPESNGNVGEVGLLNATSSNTTGNITTAGMGDFTYDQSQSIGDYAWDTTAPGTGTFLVGSGNKGASCAAISTTAGSRKSVCIINADSEPGVMIFQQ